METLQEAKQFLRNNFHAGASCPCCGQFVKLYKRTITSSMAASLIAVYQKAGVNKFVHVKEVLLDVPCLKKATLGGGDFAKLRHWKLVEELEAKRDDGGKHNGYFRITEKGEKFILGTIAVPSHILIYNNKFQGYSDGEITCQQALGNKFNFNQLMKGE